MIAIQRRIEYKWGQTIHIRPVFDVHYGNRHADILAFQRSLQEMDPESYLVGGGDLLDCIITSDLKRFRKSSDGTAGDDIIDEQIQGMVDILCRYKSRILGIGSGNHEDVITNRCGTNPIKRLCQLLDVPFLGYSWMMQLSLLDKGARGRTVNIRCHHGWGGRKPHAGGGSDEILKRYATLRLGYFFIWPRSPVAI